jgi:hypothetical protein
LVNETVVHNLVQPSVLVSVVHPVEGAEGAKVGVLQEVLSVFPAPSEAQGESRRFAPGRSPEPFERIGRSGVFAGAGLGLEGAHCLAFPQRDASM